MSTLWFLLALPVCALFVAAFADGIPEAKRDDDLYLPPTERGQQ